MRIDCPVITIDGPSGAGKGTAAMRLAKHLGYQFLDSGALYRIVGFFAYKHGLLTNTNTPLDEAAIAKLTRELVISFQPVADKKTGVLGVKVVVNGEEVSSQIRSETVGSYASKVAALPQVRTNLLALQHKMATPQGLVADGRDMGTVVFPNATLKFYLTASAEARAERRYAQLQQQPLQHKTEQLNKAAILAQIQVRDDRDMNRSTAPLKPADDAVFIDSSTLTIDDVFNQLLTCCKEKQLV